MNASEAAAFLAARRRTILLGGMAVILHGFARTTKDIDLWLDPSGGIPSWSDLLRELLRAFPACRPSRIDRDHGWRDVTPGEIDIAAGEDGLVRISGLDRPLDLFYWPNELNLEDFGSIWNRASPIEHGLRLIDEIDLMVTKQLTGRSMDESDIRFLSDKVELAYRELLRDCDPEKANGLFDRYTSPSIAAFAAEHAQQTEVRRIGLSLLTQLSNEGDPFAGDLLRDIETRRRNAN